MQFSSEDGQAFIQPDIGAWCHGIGRRVQAAGLEESPPLARGHIYFVPAGTALELAADAGSKGDDGLLLWGCAVNSRVYAQPPLPDKEAPQVDMIEATALTGAQDVADLVPA